jgi:hypothetical protein
LFRSPSEHSREGEHTSDPLPPVFDRKAVAVGGELLNFGSPIDADEPDKLGATVDLVEHEWRSLAAADAQGFQDCEAGSKLYLDPTARLGALM